MLNRIKASFQEQSLRGAAKRGDLDTVRKFAEAGIDLNAQGEARATALMLAAEQGHLEVARYLIGRHAAIDVPYGLGAPQALERAVRAGHKDMARLLIENGANVNADSGDPPFWGTPLTAAARRGEADIICLLLDKGADIEYPDGGGASPLLIAVQEGHVEATRVLIDSGADVHSATVALGYFYGERHCNDKDRNRQVAQLLEAELGAEKVSRAERHPRPSPAASKKEGATRHPPGFSL